MGIKWKQWHILSCWAPKLLLMVTAAMKLEDTCSLEGNFDKSRQCIKKQRHHFADRGLSIQSSGFSSSHVCMWELSHKESWSLKNWCFWIVVLEKIHESPWTARRSNQSILKEINPGYSWKDWCWNWSFNTLATWCEEPTHWKRPWYWESLRAGGEGWLDWRWAEWHGIIIQFRTWTVRLGWPGLNPAFSYWKNHLSEPSLPCL